jgi:hypothetical protein
MQTSKLLTQLSLSLSAMSATYKSQSLEAELNIIKTVFKNYYNITSDNVHEVLPQI